MTSYTGQVPDTHAHRHDWMNRMACQGKDPDLFFDAAREHEARTVCVVRCPVRADCLAHIMEAERGWGTFPRGGIVAGLDARQRWRMDPAAPDKDNEGQDTDGEPPRCGTAAALERHLALGEPVDHVCWSGAVRRHHHTHPHARPEPLPEAS